MLKKQLRFLFLCSISFFSFWGVAVPNVQPLELSEDAILITVELEGEATLKHLLSVEKKISPAQYKNKRVATRALNQKQKLLAEQDLILSTLTAQRIPYSLVSRLTYTANVIKIITNRKFLTQIESFPNVKSMFVAEGNRDGTLGEQVFSGKRKENNKPDTFVTPANQERIYKKLDASDEDIVIAIVNTGIDYTRASLGGCFGEGCKVIGGIDFIDGTSTGKDLLGIGTDIAEIIAGEGENTGIFPNAKLLAVKAIDPFSLYRSIYIQDAIEWALNPDGDPSTFDSADIILVEPTQSSGGHPTQREQIELAASMNVAVVMNANHNSRGGYFNIGDWGIFEDSFVVGSYSVEAQTVTSEYGPSTNVLRSGNGLMKPDFVVEEVRPFEQGPVFTVPFYEYAHGPISAAAKAVGYIAQLKSRYPDWSVEKIKYVLQSQAEDLQLPFWQQGAGLVSSGNLEAPQIFSNKYHMSFGYTDAESSEYTATKTVVLENASDIPISLNLVADTGNDNISILLPESVDINPNSTVEVPIILNADLGMLELNQGDDIGYVGFISDENHDLEVSYSFLNYSYLKLQDNDLEEKQDIFTLVNPDPATGGFLAVELTEEQTFSRIPLPENDYDLHLNWERGEYDEVNSVRNNLSQNCQLLNQISLSKTTPVYNHTLFESDMKTINLNFRAADGRRTIVGQSASDVLVEGRIEIRGDNEENRWRCSMFFDNESQELMPSLHTNHEPSEFRMLGQMLAEYDDAKVLIQNQFNESVETDFEEDVYFFDSYKKIKLLEPFSSENSEEETEDSFRLTGNDIDSQRVWTIKTFDNFEFDFWLRYKGNGIRLTQKAGFEIKRLTRLTPHLSTSDTLSEGPRIHIDSETAKLYGIKDLDSLDDHTNYLSLGQVAPYFSGELKLESSLEDTASFVVEANSSNYRAFGDTSFSNARIPINRVCELCDSVEKLTNTVRLDFDSFTIENLEEDRPVTINYEVGSDEKMFYVNGKVSSLSASITFNPTLEDYSPPTIIDFRTLSGVALSSILPDSDESSVQFELQDDSEITEITTELFYSGEWQQADFTRTGNQFDVGVEGISVNEHVGFRLVAADEFGNEVRYTANPAFKIGNCEEDIDCDHFDNLVDVFPETAMENTDTDGDGIGDNADADNDNDGLSDVQEKLARTNPNNSDTDSDGVSDALDNYPTDPFKIRDYKHLDFDGDEIADVAVRRAETSFNYAKRSMDQGIVRVVNGDKLSDIPIVGDFDGDGIADFGVRRPETFEWIIHSSRTGEKIRDTFGRRTTDIPVVFGDYDGDGITDLAVVRMEDKIWFIKNSSGSNLNAIHNDAIQRISIDIIEGDIPVPADYDGDGLTDIAFRRPSNFTWYILQSSNGELRTEQFGRKSTDIPVPADYDGDGKADLAVRRASNFTWYVKNSSGTNYNSGRADGIQRIVFGRRSDDIPVPADYDGDGITDFAVRRASNFMWYVKNSSGSNFNSSRQDGVQRIHFGKRSTDIPYAAPVQKRLEMLPN